MAASKTIWGSLPPEIRLMILKALIQEGCYLAHYATVCREWQSVVEQKSFGRLKLTPSRLAGFGDMVHRQRVLVKYIWLCIELREYDCSQCEIGETDPWHGSNTDIIKKAIRELFSVLSKWEPSRSLVLDISVHSPSDSKHQFKYVKFGSDALPEFDVNQETADSHDPRHG